MPLGSEFVQLLSRLRDVQDALGLPVHEVFHPEAAPVAIAQVDLPADRLRDPSGQGHPSPGGLDTILIGTAAKHVRAVGQGPPRQVLEPVPLLQEVVPAVVADRWMNFPWTTLTSWRWGA